MVDLSIRVKQESASRRPASSTTERDVLPNRVEGIHYRERGIFVKMNRCIQIGYKLLISLAIITISLQDKQVKIRKIRCNETISKAYV